MSVSPEGLASPVWRIAAATGEEPDDVRAALASLVAIGVAPGNLWVMIDRQLRDRPGEGIVTMAARIIAAHDTRKAHPRRH